MDDKVQKLLQRAINENLSPDRVSYIMQFNGYDQSAIDAALDELSKKKRPVLFQRQYDSSDTPSPSQQVGPPRPSEEEAPVPAPADVNLGEPLTFDQGTGGMASDAKEEEVEVSVSDWWGDKWNGLVEGVSDFMYHFDKETGNTKEQIAEFVELSKEKHPELYNSYQQNLQSEDLLNLGYDQERIKREAASQAYTDFWQTNPEIENEVVPFIRERRRQQDVEETGVKIDEAVTRELDSRFLSGAVKGLAGSIPAMVTAGATMGGSFMTTSYYAADEDLKRTFAENPDLEMTRGQQEAYKLTVAGVEGVLEKIGLSGALKGTSMAKSVLAKKVFSRLAGMGEDVSSEAFERIVKQEAKGLKGYLKNTAQGTLSEAETGALQQLSVDLINETVNGLSGQEVFTPKSAMTIIQDAIYAGAQEAVGGGIISGSVGAFSRDIATQEDFDAAEEFIGRIEISKLEENLDKRVSQDKITEAEKENILNTAKEFKQTMAKVPEDVDQESKRKIYQLINEKMNIQKKAAGKDEAIQNKAKERVEGINEQIANIYEAQSKKQAEPVAPKDGAVEAAPATEVSPEAEVETRFFAPTIEKDSSGNAVVDPGKVKEETFTGASVISKGHVDEDTAFSINSALSLLGEKANDMKVRVFDSVESLLNADQGAANFYVQNNKMPKAYIKGNEMFVLTKNAVEQYNKAKGTNVEYAKQYIHEVGHPIVSSLVAEDPASQTRLFEEIKEAAESGDAVAQRALRFGSNYSVQGQAKIENETVVEFLALVTDKKRFKSLNRSTKQKIIDFFNSLLNSISSEVVITTDAQLYDIARDMRDAYRMQKGIKIQPTTNKQYQQRSTEFSVDEGTTAGNRLFNNPLPEALAIAEKYMEARGIDYDPGSNFNTLDTEFAQEISAAYDSMEHNPKDPAVKKAYEAMVSETVSQYEAIVDEGYAVEINNNEPYSSSKDMIEDLASNKRMKIFSTESGFGENPITDDQRAENPLLRDSGFKDVNGQTLLVNDIFRFVHDFFGHAKRGNSFGPKGEENAWDAHSRMYTKEARRAMTSETRGQNSWVNFSGVNEEAFKLRDKARRLRKEGRTDEASKLVQEVYEMMSFAEQKIGLLPDKYVRNEYMKEDPEFSLDEGQIAYGAAPYRTMYVESINEAKDKFNDKGLNEMISGFKSVVEAFGGKVVGLEKSIGGWFDSEIKKLTREISFRPIIEGLSDEDLNVVAAITGKKLAKEQQDGIMIVKANPDATSLEMEFTATSEKAAEEIMMNLKDFGVYGFTLTPKNNTFVVAAFDGESITALENAVNNNIKEGRIDERSVQHSKADISFPSMGEYGEILEAYKLKRRDDGEIRQDILDLIQETLDAPSPSLDEGFSFSLDEVKGTEKIVPGNTANTVINKAKRNQRESLSVNDIDYSNISTTAQPIGLAKKMFGGVFEYKKQKKTVSLPIGIKDVKRKKKIERLVEKVRNTKGKDKVIAKKALGKEVESSIMEIKEFMKANVRMLYKSLTPEFVEKSKQWYDGANRIAQQLAKDYNVSLNQASGILAALSPQNDWFNNITNANHVMEVMSNQRDTKLSDELVGKAIEYSNGKSTKPGDSEFSIRLKKIYSEIGNVSIADLEAMEVGRKDYSIEKANIVRAISLATLSQQNKTIDPEGNIVGDYSMPHTWMTDNVIVNAINIFKDGSPETISKSLGDGNKVRNFYNNIVDPNSSNEFLTADTHALAVALASPISAADAGGFGLFGGNESITYAIVKDAYIEVANEVGILPRQLQSVTWEAVRTGVNNPARPKKKATLKLIQELSNTNLPYEQRAIEIISLNPSFTPEWAVKRGITAQKDVSELRSEYGRTTDTKDGGVPPSGRSGMGRVRGGDSGVGQGPTEGIDFSTDEGINWYESPEGKGDPAISRRDNLLEEAAQDLKAGRLKNYEFREMAKGLSPIEPITRFFAPATTERMAEALEKSKLKSLNVELKEGEVVALRLDIPAYTRSNTWVVSVHDGKKKDGKILSYRSVARITDVVFKSNPLSALSIAGGESKSTIGRMFGKYKNLKGKTPEAMAEDAKSIVAEIWNKPEWKQIGMNPTRASYFYDRKSGRPVVAAEEVVQIGGLVYAKNPVFTRWNDPAFEVKGYKDVDGSPIYFSADEGEGNINNLRGTLRRVNSAFKTSRERILANPDAYYTKQSLKAIKENLELMTEDELLENMTAEGLNRVANQAGTGRGENDISVLAAVELINRKSEAGEDVSELLVDLAKVGTTVGRMLRHFAELKSATPLGIVATIEGALAKANRIMSATQVERLTDIADRFIKAGQVVKDLRDEIESEYSKETEAKLIKASKDLDKVTRELNKFTSLIVPKKTMSLLSTTIQGNLLTPISQVTNVGANLFQIATSIPVRGFETLFSKITGKFTGGTKRSFKYSLMAVPFALKRGGIGVAEAIETIIRGGASTDKIIHTGFLPGAALLAAISDTRFASMVNKTLGKEAIKGDVLPQMANGKINPVDRLKALYEGVFGVAPEIMFRFLALGDKPFSRFSEGMETYQQAARLGLKGEALKNYIKYPNKKQQKAIEEAGRRLTFQDDSIIATGFFGATNWLERQGPIGGAVAFALKLTMPYVKTPANIFVETLKFAVPGIGMASAIRNFQKKNFDEGASDLAKAATGQMLVMAANALIANGLVSGAFGEEDEEERSLKYLKFPPMSINKSGLARLMRGENPDYRDGDVFMRYDKFGIVGMVIGARVTSIKNNLVEAKGQAEGYYVGEKDKGFFEPFTRVFDELFVGLGTMQFLNSQSFLTGANGLLSVLSGDADERTIDRWFENTFRSVTAIPLPNTLSALHRSIREYMPNLRTNSVENKFRYILMDRLFSTDGVPIKIDMLGNKIPQTPEGANKWIYNLLDFTKTQDSRDQFILNEIYRLYELQEEADLIPGFPTKIQKIPTKHPETGAKITGWDAQKEEEYRRGLQDIQEVYGKNRAEILERLFRSDSYQTLTNERKQERVIETLQDYDRGYKMIKALPGSGMKNLKPPMEWAKMLNELNDKYFD